jgi:hypothetical protein
VQGTHLLTGETLKHHVALYHALLDKLVAGDFDIEAMKKVEFLNDWLLPETGLAKP